MKAPMNRTLGRKLATKYHMSHCMIKRKTEVGWVIVASMVPIYITDSSQHTPRPDPYDAGTDNTRTWSISFLETVDVRMADQLHGVYTSEGEALPILTVATDLLTDARSSHWVRCQAEDSAVMREWITFWRHDALDESDTPRGPYECTVDWEDIAGYDPTSYFTQTHMSFAVLTGHEDMDVQHTDLVESVDGHKGFVVVEVRKPIAGRKEVRVRGDIGFRD